MKTLFIDPGTTCPGAAIFTDTKRLFSARYFRGDGFHDDLVRVAELAQEVADWAKPHGPFIKVGFEWPRVYRAGFNPDRLLPLAAFAGALLAFLWDSFAPACEFPLVRPSQWKGTVKKKVTARQMLAVLKPGEMDAMDEAVEFYRDLLVAEERPNGDLRHPTNNTMDAMGIGLFMLGRLRGPGAKE